MECANHLLKIGFSVETIFALIYVKLKTIHDIPLLRSKNGLSDRFLFASSIMYLANSPLELHGFTKLSDKSTDDPNKNHYSLRAGEIETKMLSQTSHMINFTW